MTSQPFRTLYSTEPWLVDARRVFPQKLLRDNFSYSNVLSDWHIFGIGNEFMIWNVPNTSTPQQQATLSPSRVLEIPHEFLQTAVSNDLNVLHIYSYYQGTLTLHKITRDSDADPPLVSVKLPENLHVTNLNVYWPALQGAPVICVSANDQELYYIQQINVPSGLRPHKVAPVESVIARFRSLTTYKEPSAKVVRCFGKPECFFTISESGTVTVWTVTRNNARYSFETKTQPISLKSHMVKHFEETNTADMEELHVKDAAYENGKLFAIVLTHHSDDEWRVYCLILENYTVTCTLWLNRFVNPKTVNIQSLCTQSNGVCYLAVTEDSHLPTALLAIYDSETHEEIDLRKENQFEGKLLSGLFPDTATYGVNFYDKLGMGVRAVFDMGKIDRKLPSASVGDGTPIPILVKHLQSAFEASISRPDESRSDLPQSIRCASVEDLAATVLQVRSPTLEKHHCYIEFLSQIGLYKTLDSCTKWNLMGIGQDLCVKQSLEPAGAVQTAIFARLELTPHQSMSDFLHREYTTIVESGNSKSMQDYIVLCLKGAEVSIEYFDRYSGFYGLKETQKPKISSAAELPLWTSRKKIRRVFQNIVEYFKETDKPERCQRAGAETVQKAVELALKSFGDAYAWCPNDHAVKEQYKKIQHDTFGILDGIATDTSRFELCIEYLYFHGVCRIAHEHSRRRDRANYDIIPLFEKLKGKENVDGVQFAEFALRWFAHRKFDGHVFHYGQHCREELSLVINTTESLKKHRWIHDVQCGNFAGAAMSLMETNILNDTKQTVGEGKTLISLASLLNRVAEKESVSSRECAQECRRIIDNKKELVHIQSELDGADASKDRLMSSRSLFNKLLKNLDEKDADVDKKVKTLFQILAVSTTFDDESSIRDAAQLAWFLSIATELDAWEGWLGHSDLTSPILFTTILATSAFGKLLLAAKGEKTWAHISIECFLEDPVTLKSWGDLENLFQRDNMKRLLKGVVKAAEQHAEDDSAMMSE